MTLLNKAAILAANDLPHEDVEVPEWGGTVRVRALTGTERDAYESSLVTAKGEQNLADVRAKLCAASIVDESGATVFSAADIAALGKKNGAALDRVALVAQRLSRLGLREAEAIEGN